MSLHEQVAALRAESGKPRPRHISIDTADALNHLAGRINGGMGALWDALELVARAVDESRGQAADQLS